MKRIVIMIIACMGLTAGCGASGEPWANTGGAIEPGEAAAVDGGDIAPPGEAGAAFTLPERTPPPVTVGDVTVEVTRGTDPPITLTVDGMEGGFFNVVTTPDVLPYEAGEILIIMYHGLVDGEPPSYYQRNRDDFRNDLLALWERGFRVMPLKDLAEGNIGVDAGYTPVVITFDDGESSSFSLIEGGGGLTVDPECALGIMMDFDAAHPGFGHAATFFINGGDSFKGAGALPERLKYLIDNGCDVGNHTDTHPELNKMNAGEVQREIGAVDRLIRDGLPGYEPFALAYPFGIRPKEELRGYAMEGEADGRAYSYKFALREGMSGASMIPWRRGFDAANIPRARGSSTEGEGTDLWGRLRFYDENPEYRYISDGNPKTVAVPRDYAGNVDEAALGGLELVIYD